MEVEDRGFPSCLRLQQDPELDLRKHSLQQEVACIHNNSTAYVPSPLRQHSSMQRQLWYAPISTCVSFGHELAVGGPFLYPQQSGSGISPYKL